KWHCVVTNGIKGRGVLGECVDDVSATIEILENNPCTNVGRGANLTEDGYFECYASVMEGNMPEEK
ncbi:hypothetical protein M8C21_025087, partial [Ambrosia artemisiifolia]